MSESVSTASLTQGSYQLAQFEKALTENKNLNLTKAQDGSLYVNGKMARLEGKRVVIGESAASKWQRAIYKVISLLRMHRDSRSFDDFWHKKQCDLSKKLCDRLVSRSDIVFSQDSKAEQPARKNMMKCNVPAEIIKKCREENHQLSVFREGIRCTVFEDSQEMKSHLLGKAEETLKYLFSCNPCEESFKTELMTHLESGLNEFLQGKYSWDEMISVIQELNAEFVRQKESECNSAAAELEKMDEISDMRLSAVTRGAGAAELVKMDKISEMLLSAVTREAGQVCCSYSKETGNHSAVYMPVPMPSGKEPEFTACDGKTVTVYPENTAPPEPCNEQKGSSATQGSGYSPIVRYGISGASQLSLNGFFYQPGVSFTDQFKAFNEGDKPIRLFDSQAELEKFVDSMHAKKLEEWEEAKSLRQQYEILSDDWEEKNPPTRDETFAELKEKYTLAYFELSLNGFFCPPGVPLEPQLTGINKGDKSVQLFNSQAELEKFVDSMHAKNLHRWTAEEYRRQQYKKLSGNQEKEESPPTREETLAALKEKYTLAYFDIKHPAPEGAKVARFLPEDTIVLLGTLQEDNRIAVTACPAEMKFSRSSVSDKSHPLDSPDYDLSETETETETNPAYLEKNAEEEIESESQEEAEWQEAETWLARLDVAQRKTAQLPKEPDMEKDEKSELLEKRVDYLKKAFKSRFSPKSKRKNSIKFTTHPNTLLLLKMIDEGVPKRDSQLLILRALGSMLEGQLSWKDMKALNIPTSQCLTYMGISSKKVVDLDLFADEIYLGLSLLYISGKIDKKLFNSITKELSVSKSAKQASRLLFKVQEHVAGSVSEEDIKGADEDSVKQMLCSQYAQGRIRKKELFSLNYTQKDIMSALEIDTTKSSEQQFCKLYEKREQGQVTQKIYTDLLGAIPGGRKLGKQMEMVRYIEPESELLIPERMKAIMKQQKLKSALTSCMERYFGRPLPKSDTEAFNRFYIRNSKPPHYGTAACNKVLAFLGGWEKLEKLQKLAEVYSPDFVTKQVEAGKLDREGPLNKLLTNAFCDEKVTLSELMEIGLQPGDIVRYLSVVEMNELLALQKLDMEMLEQAGVTAEVLKSSNARIQLLQETVESDLFEQWEQERVLSDDFVKEKLLSLCAEDKITPANLYQTGISYDEILPYIKDADDKLALCLQGAIPPEQISEELEQAEWEWIVNDLNGEDTEWEKFAKLQDLLKKESDLPVSEKTIIPQRLSLVVKDVPAQVMEQYGFGERYEDDQTLQEAAKSLYVAGILPDTAMFMMGFYDADLARIQEEVSTPVSFSGLPEDIREKAQSMVLGNPDMMQKVAYEEYATLLPEENPLPLENPEQSTAFASSLDDLPPEPGNFLMETLVTDMAQAHEEIKQPSYDEVMKRNGFSTDHLSDEDFRWNAGLLYKGGILPAQEMKAMGFNDSSLQEFSEIHKLPVKLKKLDKTVRKNLVQWFKTNKENKGVFTLAANFSGKLKLKVPNLDGDKKEDQTQVQESTEASVSASAEPLSDDEAGSVQSENADSVETPDTDTDTDTDTNNDSEVDEAQQAQNAEVNSMDESPEDARLNSVEENLETVKEETSPQYNEIMEMTKFNFLDEGRMIKKYYEQLLDTTDFDAVKQKMAEDIDSGSLKKALDAGEVSIDMGGWKKGLDVYDTGPLKDYLQ